MKKSRLFIVVLIWGACLIQLFINSAIDKDKQFVEASATISSENIHSCEIKAYAHYDNSHLSEESKKTISINLAKKLGITDGYEITTSNQPNATTTKLLKDGANATTIISVISLITDNKDALNASCVENYILIEISLLPHESSNANNIKKKLTEIYKDLDMKPSTNIYIETLKRGKMTEDEITHYTDTLFEKLNAKECFSKEFENYICVYGYSSDISEYVYQDDTPVNVNIIYTYDEDEDITYIHKAIPFVDKSL